MLAGETAFQLYDTYGFPLDLTQDAVRTKGLTVNLDGFDAAMTRQREMAREAWTGSGQVAAAAEWFGVRERLGPTVLHRLRQHRGHRRSAGPGAQDGHEVDAAVAGQTVQALFDRTPFYAESGGQAGDQGEVDMGTAAGQAASPTSRNRPATCIVHDRRDPGAACWRPAPAGAACRLTPRTRGARAPTTRPPTCCTRRCRNVLGRHVTQKGQMVDGERMRFDFSHGAPLTADELDAHRGRGERGGPPEPGRPTPS